MTERTPSLSWQTRLNAARAALGGRRYLIGVANVAIGIAAYGGFAALIGVPTWAIIAFTTAVSVAFWLWARLVELENERKPQLTFFTGEHRPLCLNEDLSSSKPVYCIGLRNDGLKTVRNVRVNIDGVEGHPRPIFPARLKIFGINDDSVDLHSGETEYFCVTRVLGSPGLSEGKASICCHNGLINTTVPLNELVNGRTIFLSACGDGAPKTTMRIRMSSKQEQATWSLDLKLMPIEAVGDIERAGTVADVVPPAMTQARQLLAKDDVHDRTVPTRITRAIERLQTSKRHAGEAAR